MLFIFQEKGATLITFPDRILDGFMKESPLYDSKNENLHHVFTFAVFIPSKISEVLYSLQCSM